MQFQRETDIYLLWRPIYVFREHLLSYSSTESVYQSLQHLCICIFNSHLINRFTTFYIGLKPGYHIYHIQHFTSLKTTTSFSNYGFSIHLSRYHFPYITFSFYLYPFVPKHILVCIRLQALYRQCLINCFFSDCFYSLSESAASLSPCDCS